MSNQMKNTENKELPPITMLPFESVPATGNSLVIPDNCNRFLINPAGTIAALNLKFPLKPIDNQEVTYNTTQDITLLILQPNTSQTVFGSPAAALFAAGSSKTWWWSTKNSTWYIKG